MREKLTRIINLALSELIHKADEAQYDIYNDPNYCFIVDTLDQDGLTEIDLTDIAESYEALQYTIWKM